MSYFLVRAKFWILDFYQEIFKMSGEELSIFQTCLASAGSDSNGLMQCISDANEEVSVL